MEFLGTDSNNNELLDIYNLSSGNTGAPVKIPTRQNTLGIPSTWLPSITTMPGDKIKVCLLDCSSGLWSGNSNSRTEDINCVLPNDVIVYKQDATCGVDDGSINITLPQEYEPYEITWFDDEGAELTQFANYRNLYNLGAGNYCYKIQDNNCCEVFACVFLNAIYPGVIDVEADITHKLSQSCPGSIDLTIDCGVPPYAINWAGPNGFTSQSEDISNLSDGGFYYVTVTDQMNQSSFNSFTLFIVPPEIDAIVDSRNSYCTTEGGQDYATCDASIDIDLSEFPGFIGVSWVGPNGFTSQDEDIIDLCPGTYTLTVFLTPTCFFIETYEICCCVIDDILIGGGDGLTEVNFLQYCDPNQQNINPISLSGTINPINTVTGDLGEIDLNIVGGLAPFEISWTGPNGFIDNAEDIQNLVDPGNYCVTVSDGCSEDNECFDVVDCGIVDIQLNESVQSTCGTINVGSIIISPSGGTAPYTYQWNNGSNSNILDKLGVGTYCVTVSDNNNCSEEACFNIISEGEAVEQQLDGECRFAYFCDGVLIEGTERPGVEELRLDENDCRIGYKFCIDDFFPSGEQQIGGEIEFGTYFVTLENIDPWGCPYVEERCFGTNQQADPEDLVYYPHSAILITPPSEVFTPNFNPDPNSNDCNECWEVSVCEYLSMNIEVPDEDRFHLIDPVPKWYIIFDDNPGSLCSNPGEMCLVEVFCFLDANPDPSNFWYSGCYDDNLCLMDPEDPTVLDALNICEDPPTLDEVLNLNDDEIVKIREADILRKIKESRINTYNYLIYPNPFRNEVFVQFKKQGIEYTNVIFEIFDVKGSVIKSLRKPQVKGNDLVEIDLPSSLPGGMYILVISTDRETLFRTKIIKY